MGTTWKNHPTEDSYYFWLWFFSICNILVKSKLLGLPSYILLFPAPVFPCFVSIIFHTSINSIFPLRKTQLTNFCFPSKWIAKQPWPSDSLLLKKAEREFCFNWEKLFNQDASFFIGFIWNYITVTWLGIENKFS